MEPASFRADMLASLRATARARDDMHDPHVMHALVLDSARAPWLGYKQGQLRQGNGGFAGTTVVPACYDGRVGGCAACMSGGCASCSGMCSGMHGGDMPSADAARRVIARRRAEIAESNIYPEERPAAPDAGRARDSSAAAAEYIAEPLPQLAATVTEGQPSNKSIELAADVVRRIFERGVDVTDKDNAVELADRIGFTRDNLLAVAGEIEAAAGGGASTKSSRILRAAAAVLQRALHAAETIESQLKLGGDATAVRRALEALKRVTTNYAIAMLGRMAPAAPAAPAAAPVAPAAPAGPPPPPGPGTDGDDEGDGSPPRPPRRRRPPTPTPPHHAATRAAEEVVEARARRDRRRPDRYTPAAATRTRARAARMDEPGDAAAVPVAPAAAAASAPAAAAAVAAPR